MKAVGLKDKNGKELCEGDIVSHRCRGGIIENFNTYYSKVVWNPDISGWGLSNNTRGVNMEGVFDLEVIANSNDTELLKKCLSLMEEYNRLECYPLSCEVEVEMTRVIELVREKLKTEPSNDNPYSPSSISEFERNKPVKTRKSLTNLIGSVEKMNHFDKVYILKELETIKTLLENGD